MRKLVVGLTVGMIAGLMLSEVPQVNKALQKGKKTIIKATK